MEKIITIGEKTFPAKSNAASFIAYKANFKRDAMRDMLKLAKGFVGKSNVTSSDDILAALADNDDFDLDVFSRFLWVFAKAADKSIPPYEDWLGTFDVAPFEFFVEVFPQVQDMILSNVTTGVKPKKAPAAGRAKK